MPCPFCGFWILKSDKFCSDCGGPIGGNHEPRTFQKLLDWRRYRGFQLMSRNMAALIPKLPGGTPGIYDFGRAGGDAICEKCGLEFIEHPKGLEEFLHLLCDGRQVQL